MKKVLIMAAFAVFGLSQAQEAASSSGSDSGISYGIKAGVNIANLPGDFDGYSSRAGFVGGVYANIPFANQFAFQPELLYSMQGATNSDFETSAGTATDVKTPINYINLPLMVQWYPKGASEGFYAELGPQLGLAVSAKYKYRIGEVDIDNDAKDDINSFNFGSVVGLGYVLPMGLNFNVRYHMGFTDVVKNSVSDDNVHNSVFSFMVGYSF